MNRYLVEMQLAPQALPPLSKTPVTAFRPTPRWSKRLGEIH
ncbi:MAG: hypothetical protein R2867_38370 [Caldilineaceae bacterium]